MVDWDYSKQEHQFDFIRFKERYERALEFLSILADTIVRFSASYKEDEEMKRAIGDILKN